MKRISAVLVLLVAAISLMSISCGTSDYIKSLTLTATGGTSGGLYNLAGVDGTIQLTVTANYNSGKTIDVTNASTWNVSPIGCVSSGNPNSPCGSPLPAYGPTTVTISPSGLMTTVEDVCTWVDTYNTTVTPQVLWNPPVWVLTGYYQVTATYRNFTSQPIGIGVGSATSNSPSGGCGPA